MRSAILACLLLAPSLHAQPTNPFQLLKAPVPPGATKIPYGPDPLQFGELRLPATKGPHPVAIIVHGGCWTSQLADMPPDLVSLNLLRPMAAELSAQGIATWNIEYRRLANPGGGWPGTFLDVARAADHLRTLANANSLDLTRTIAIGHSAGGHLALWLAARKNLPKNSELATPNPLPLKAVLNLDGPGDLAAALPMTEPVCGAPVIEQLLGGLPSTHPARYKQASPAELLPLGIPQASFAGQMFADFAPAYQAAAKKSGDPATLTLDPKGGHFDWIDPKSAKWEPVFSTLTRLLRN
jgi:acetyl esterase/lipase